MKYDRAFHVEMPIKGNTGMLLSEQPFEGQLAILDRLAAMSGCNRWCWLVKQRLEADLGVGPCALIAGLPTSRRMVWPDGISRTIDGARCLLERHSRAPADNSIVVPD